MTEWTLFKELERRPVRIRSPHFPKNKWAE